MSPSPEPLSLFGELDGLFAPPTISTTPIAELTIPRDEPTEVHYRPTQGGTHVEPVEPDCGDEWDDRACLDYEPDEIDGPTGEHCIVCGWPESEHTEHEIECDCARCAPTAPAAELAPPLF